MYNVTENEEGEVLWRNSEKTWTLHRTLSCTQSARLQACLHRKTQIDGDHISHYETKFCLKHVCEGSQSRIKKDMKVTNWRIYFDHDYLTAVLNKQRIQRSEAEENQLQSTTQLMRLQKTPKDRGSPVKVPPPQWILWSS